MKYLGLLLSMTLLITSCKEEEIEVANIRIDHFKATAVGLGPGLALQVQEDDEIGKGDWYNFYSPIEGFVYEWGYVYNLKVSKRSIANPPEDASSIAYSLEEIVSKEAVATNVTFNIDLQNVSNSIENTLQKDDDTTFTLLYEQQIDCGQLCDELEEALIGNNRVTGTFVHADDGKILLQRLSLE